MADVRSMLRAERANRRITHPNASYTSDGKLLCNLCETTVKSEAAWGAHLHSTQHALRLNRAQDAASARKSVQTPISKKRKASDIESPAVDDSKRLRPTQMLDIGDDPKEPQQDFVDTFDNEDDVQASANREQTRIPASDSNFSKQSVTAEDDEFAAFEREIAAMDGKQSRPTALSAGATISAAPMTAEEIRAKEQEARDDTRGRRDAEIEEEREDAARLLEEEFEEMEGLEERVRKLRRKREALRHVHADENRSSGISIPLRDAMNLADHNHDHIEASGTSEGIPKSGGVDENEGEDEDDDDEDDDYDSWRFGET